MLKPYQIITAHKQLQRYIKPSPLIYSAALSELSGAKVWLKLECRNPTGSFKIRGATYKMLTLGEEAHQRGIVTASAGNHGLGTSFAAQAIGLTNVTIFVPETTPTAKLAKLRRFPTTLHIVGQTYDDAHHAATEFGLKTGAIYLPAYDDPQVITGAGTVGLEIIQELPEVQTILVPVGGGGLIAGIGVAVKGLHPGCRLIGLQPDASPAAKISLEQNMPVEEYDAAPTIADGLSGGFGAYPFYIGRTLIDAIELATETELRRAIFTLIDQEQLIVEASGAIAITPLLRPEHGLRGQTVVCVLTGSNIDSRLLTSILGEFAK